MKRLLLVLLFISIGTAYAQQYPPFETLELEDTSGAIINTTSLTGKLIYVDFWFTRCAPCLAEIPYTQALQQYFSKDTNIVFLSICIESADRKQAWKEMIQEKQLPGIHLFYARNRPQKVNLLRKYDIKFPTYILVNKKHEVIDINMARPSESGWIYWALTQALKGVTPHESAEQISKDFNTYQKFMDKLPSQLPPGIINPK